MSEPCLLAIETRSSCWHDLHVRVDKFSEIPAITLVFITVAWLWLNGNPFGTAFYVMFSAGLIAICANAHCVWLVFKRRDAAHPGNWADFDHMDHQQHKVGAIVLLGLTTAIVAGVLGRV